MSNAHVAELSIWPRLNEHSGPFPAWLYAAYGFAALTIIFFAAMLLSDIQFNGVNAWTKPFKFSLSIAVFFATTYAFTRWLSEADQHSRGARFWVSITVASAVFEIFYIALQASQGQASHFNQTSPLHGILYGLMGVGAFLMVASLLWLAWRIARNNSLSEPVILAVVAGLALTFLLGGGLGGYMASSPGHWVNAPQTDAGGLWFFNWTRSGGDLRVAHFFGMHAMQALPLFALLLPRAVPRNVALALVVAFTMAYSAFTVVTFNQAVSGVPFIAFAGG